MLIPAPSDELCLAFANTLSWRGRANPAESLHGYPDLVGWLRQEARFPVEAGVNEAAAADAVFAQAIVLRETMYRLFSALAGDHRLADLDVARLNEALAAAPARTRLAAGNAGYGWWCENLPDSAPGLLAPVLWSAGDLLSRPEHSRLRLCANDACLWLFLDHSKAGTRRWCDMSSCGNRAKAHRHYLKSKTG